MQFEFEYLKTGGKPVLLLTPLMTRAVRDLAEGWRLTARWQGYREDRPVGEIPPFAVQAWGAYRELAGYLETDEQILHTVGPQLNTGRLLFECRDPNPLDQQVLFAVLEQGGSPAAFAKALELLSPALAVSSWTGEPPEMLMDYLSWQCYFLIQYQEESAEWERINAAPKAEWREVRQAMEAAITDLSAIPPEPKIKSLITHLRALREFCFADFGKYQRIGGWIAQKNLQSINDMTAALCQGPPAEFLN
jgi:hypothetical protein